MDDNNDEKPKNKGGFAKGYDPRRSVGGRKTRDELGKATVDEARKHSPEMLAIMIDIARHGKKDSDRIAAANKVIVRAYGQAPMTMKVESTFTAEHNITSTLNVESLSLELKRELLEQMLAPPPIEGELIEQREDNDDSQ